MRLYLGIDVGSVTTKLAALDAGKRLIAKLYLPTGGRPAAMVLQGLREVKEKLPVDFEICGVAVTGSARQLAGAVVGADLVKNEITCQALGALHLCPEAKTIIEIGGQDSKIIFIQDGLVADFGMNTVCAAGTGSFLDHQAQRLDMSRDDFGMAALASRHPRSINARCTVFAESDMVHQQQTGHSLEDIVYGLCRALARNYLGDVAGNREIRPPVIFQGGVAFNPGMVRAFEEELHTRIIVPRDHEVVGAIGAALLVQEEMSDNEKGSRFKGFEIAVSTNR